MPRRVWHISGSMCLHVKVYVACHFSCHDETKCFSSQKQYETLQKWWFIGNVQDGHTFSTDH